MRFAFIGRLLENKKQVQTLTVLAGGQYVDNILYDLDGTPYQDILDFSKELIPRNAAKQYPNDQMLIDIGVESYYRAPMFSSDNTLLGWVSVMDVKPMQWLIEIKS